MTIASEPRPRRSVLYMPGANRCAMAKARTLACDGVILDLEDAVSADAKAEARAAVVAEVTAGGFGRRELVVRINGLDTPWGADDLAAIAGLDLAAVLIPKVESASRLELVRAHLDRAGRSGTALWAMIETPLGVLQVAEVARADVGLEVLVLTSAWKCS